MAATASKPFPGGLQRFIHGTEHETHRDYAQQAPAASSSSSSQFSSFRSAAWPDRQQGGTDDDFGRFASPSSPFQSSTWDSVQKPWERAQSSSSSSRWSAIGGAAAPGGPAATDGADILSLLSTSAMTDEVHGDWAKELADSQSQKWKVENETRMPRDPIVDVKGKGKARQRDGDTSPTSEEILSSLSSMDLKNVQYLKTLLAGNPEDSLKRYLDSGSYADDVWGLPEEVKRLLEKAESGGTVEEGRAKAVKRLQMVMRHIWGEKEGVDEAIRRAATPPIAATTSLTSTSQPRESGGADWAAEMAAQSSFASPQTTHSMTSNATATHETHSSALATDTSQRASSFPIFQTHAYPSSTFAHSVAAQQVRGEHVDFAMAAAAQRPKDNVLSLPRDRSTLVPPAQEKRREETDGEADQIGEEELPPFQDFMIRRLVAMGGSPGI
ncbi:hypothetical protein T439DRAFT_323386 [Meredithblackwellia eburnea MCA 4105]